MQIDHRKEFQSWRFERSLFVRAGCVSYMEKLERGDKKNTNKLSKWKEYGD